MKRTMIFLLCIAAALSFTACSGGNTDSTTGSSSGSVQIANPIVDCDTLEDAAELTGFDMTAPDAIGEFTDCTIQVINNELIQVIYQNGYNQICVRKASGSDDISGDYNEYAESNTVSVGDLQVTMKGADGTVNVAVWTNDGYSYSVQTASGLSSSAMSDLITGIY